MNSDSSMTTMPRDWSTLGKRLDNWSPPSGGFDPSIQWATHYARHSLIPERNGKPGGARAGALHIEYTLKNDDLVRLQVSEVEKAGFTTMTTQAGINCANNGLLTPRRWSLSCSWQNPLKVVKNSELDQQQKGHVEGKELVLQGSSERRVPAPRRWTTFWNLFAAIQHLPFDASATLNFDLFEAFDQHKAQQRITYAGRHPIALKNKSLDLHVFEQTGCGIMPWHWWLDDQHRVVLAAGNRRAYLLMECKQGGVA
ncbi:MAG: hypothetical protein PF904_20170 [Kiritimatiellae bacterium]|jgi:hypothetical protein|nr:hypothetical protein [Kiritimatiellia bacterium]